MPEQLTFELAPPEPPTFANFLPGANGELVATLARLARGDVGETGVMVWGPPGAGKSHLLAATVAAARAAGHVAHHVARADDADPGLAAPGVLVAVDDVDRASAAGQARLFTLYNGLAAAGGHLMAAAGVPPARLALRDDLRTRLGYGLVYELAPLGDAAKPAALVRYAQARGFTLPADVVVYLLAHYPRDMASLVAAVAALDRHSLAVRRAVTVPFVRDLLTRDPDA